MENLKLEYLLILQESNSSGFYNLCNNKKRFCEVLEINSSLIFESSKIRFNGIDYEYELNKGEVEEKNQNYFYLTIIFEFIEDNFDSYRQLIKKLNEIFYKNKFVTYTLLDDFSFYYSQKAYSLIHKIENQMRKFITYFMVIKVGNNWVDETSPSQIKKALDNSKRKDYIDILQQLDFIHLGNFLFHKYSLANIDNLFKEIMKLKQEETITVEELKDFIPTSNWDKYFKNIVNCNDDYLKVRWEKLYDLRNKIAHTSHFTKDNFIEIEDLYNEVKDKLDEAFKNINQIELNDDDKIDINDTFKAKETESEKDLDKTSEYISLSNSALTQSIGELGLNSDRIKAIDEFNSLSKVLTQSIDGLGLNSDITKAIDTFSSLSNSALTQSIRGLGLNSDRTKAIDAFSSLSNSALTQSMGGLGLNSDITKTIDTFSSLSNSALTQSMGGLGLNSDITKAIDAFSSLSNSALTQSMGGLGLNSDRTKTIDTFDLLSNSIKKSRKDKKV